MRPPANIIVQAMLYCKVYIARRQRLKGQEHVDGAAVTSIDLRAVESHPAECTASIASYVLLFEHRNHQYPMSDNVWFLRASDHDAQRVDVGCHRQQNNDTVTQHAG